MAKDVRIGIVGAGGVADVYHVPVLAKINGTSVLWVCDKDGKRAARFAQRHNIAAHGTSLEALPDVDVVLIAIPVGAREGVLETAFRRKWHVFAEKPFALNTLHHERILNGARLAGIQIGVGLMRRFYRSTRTVQSLLRSGAFGTVREIWAAEGGPMRGTGRGDDWYQNDVKASGGGVLIETGSHLVDQAFFAADIISCERIQARTRCYDGLDLDARVGAYGKREGQDVSVAMRFALSRIVDICPGIFFICERGILKAELGADGRVQLVDEEFRPLTDLSVELRAADAVFQAFYLEWEMFLEQCRTGAPTGADAVSARLSTELITKAYAVSNGAQVPTR